MEDIFDTLNSLGYGEKVTKEQVPRISTGIYALNKIISGSIYAGIRGDKMLALAGPSNSGKSYVLANLVREAQASGLLPILFDSESAVDGEYYERIGVDLDKLYRVPVMTVEEIKFRFVEIVDAIMEKHPGVKLFVGLDSLGNMPSSKEISDSVSGNPAGDMGTRAKAINSLFRVIGAYMGKYKFPFVFINHVYMDPSSMSSRGIMSGGMRPIYNSWVILYFTRKNLKRGSDRVGLTMKIVATKNRDVPEEQPVEIEVNFKNGISPYSGLLDDAKRFGLIKAHGAWYTNIKEEKKYRRDDPELWLPIIDELDKKLRAENQYSITNIDNITDGE